MMKFFFGVCALAAGAAAALQSAANGGLAQRIGLGGALVINTSIVLAGSVALWLATGARTALFQTGTPAVFYLGGVFGFVIIAGMASSLPRLGAGWAWRRSPSTTSPSSAPSDSPRRSLVSQESPSSRSASLSFAHEPRRSTHRSYRSWLRSQPRRADM